MRYLPMNTEQALATESSSVAAALDLTIVIPAYNEEDAIADTIQACLDARELIQQAGQVRSTEIIVVSDGSTDRTVEIASQFEEVKVVVFPRNRGYGAAIKEGWRIGRGDLLGFLDADGTCDPRFFAPLCRTLQDEAADVVLGSRLNPESQMPPVRRLGNRLYAFLLGMLCGKQVTDTASGMRVVSRRSLAELYPLPDGLHFTPSMSAKALLNDMRLIEVPMSYQERVGTSKLSVLRDGVRFLRTILASVLCYRPERLMLAALVMCLLAMILLAAHPVEFYLRHHSLEEWMIYRYVACHLLGMIGLTLLLGIVLIYRTARFGPRRRSGNEFWPHIISILFGRWGIVLTTVLLLFASVFFLWPGIVEYATTRQTTLHWSRLLAGSFTLFSAVQTLIFGLMLETIAQWTKQDARKQGDSSSL